MHLGKKVRMERIFNRTTGRAIVVPMDHGVSVGPIDGLLDMRKAVNDVAGGEDYGVNAVLMHKGLFAVLTAPLAMTLALCSPIF